MGKRALKDIPLREITLRKYEEPSNLEHRELTKKFLLSVGLLQPGESRDIIVDIFHSMVLARKEQKHFTMEMFLEKLKDKPGASAPNIRRQLRRLRELKMIEKNQEGFRIAEFGSLCPIVDQFIIQYFVNPSLERIKQYAKALDEI
jgi:hypothetical protein